MKNLARLALLASLTATLSCAHFFGDDDPPQPAKRFGATTINSQQGQWVTPLPACCAATATTYVQFTTTTNGDNTRGLYPGLQRVLFRWRANQAVTVLYQTLAAGSTTWRTLNGSGSGDAVLANTDYATDFLVLGPDVRVAVTTGGTAPTTIERAVEIFNDRALGMFQ